MKLVNAQNRIQELMSRFVAQIEMAAAMSRTDLNKAAETILIPLLNEVYGWSLENINYAEDNNNYPGIDLADEVAEISVQVTATPTLEKVKHTLEQFTKHNQYLKYNRLIIYILKKKQDSYSETAIQGIIQNKFSFDSQKDIWDHRNILKEVSNFQIGRTLRVQEILEANFGGDQRLPSLLADSLEQRINWRETCRELLNHWKGLTTNALTKPNGVRFQLDEIFVPLGVVERREKPKHRSNDGFPAEQGSELYEEKVTPISQNDFFEQVLRQGQSKHSQGSRIAIIGEPGAGKTTQLQKIAHWILEETDGIPIWVPLTAVGAKKLKDYLLSDWLQTAIDELDVSQGHRDELGQLLKTGKVWLLLDGVDEMALSNALYQINTQMREGWLRNVRVVLTCRLNVWDAGKNALDGFDVYRNLDFEYPTEVHQFINQWFATEPALQQTLKVALEQPGKERIRDMVKNPLRLTLLCYSWQLRQGELPETKAGLFEWFVDAFYEWNKGKVPTNLSVAKREELNRALGELAKEAIDQETSRFRLREKSISRFLGDADDEDSLFYLALQLGWLNRIGVAAENSLENVYAFFHPTFQEYFAALAIDDWSYFFNHIPSYPKEGTYRIFESQWKESILLWLGRKEINVLVKDSALSSLLLFEDNCNNFYWIRSCFLAVESLDEVESFCHSDFALWLLIKCAFGFDIEKRNWSTASIFFEGIQEEAQEEARRTIKLIRKSKSQNLLEKLIDIVEDAISQDEWLSEHHDFSDYLRLQVIECLIEIDPYNLKATKDILKIIQNNFDNLTTEKDVFGIQQAIKLLRKSKLEIPEIFETLIKLCQSENCEVRKLSVESLGATAYPHIRSIEILTNLLDSQDYELVRIAAESLCRMNPVDKKAFQALMGFVMNCSNYEQLRYRNFFDSLANIAKSNLEAKTYLEKLLESNDLEKEVICEMAGSLVYIDDKNIKSLEILENILFESLNKIKNIYSGSESMPTVERINVFSRFFYPDYSRNKYNDLLCFRLCEILNRINKNREEVMEALVFLVRYSDDYIVPIHAASLLLKYDAENPDAIERLVREIEVNQCFYCMAELPKIKDTRLRNRAIEVLEVIAESTSLEDFNPSINKIESVNASAIEALAMLDSENLKSLSRLIYLLKQNQEQKLLIQKLDKILPSNYFKVVISELKPSLNTQTYQSERNLYNNCFKTLWYCAQNMSYSDFRQAWHDSPSAGTESSTDD